MSSRCHVIMQAISSSSAWEATFQEKFEGRNIRDGYLLWIRASKWWEKSAAEEWKNQQRANNQVLLATLKHKEETIRVLLVALKACSRTRNLGRGKKLHAEAVKCGHDSDIYVANTLINMYGKCGSMVEACQVFESLKNPTVVSWTTLILGYADNDQGQTALKLFNKMKSEGPAPDSVTLVAALRACTSLAAKGYNRWTECKDNGKKIHSYALENGCNRYVQNTLIDMYAKCGSMVDAREVFDCMKHPDVVSWNVLILGYAENGEGHTALKLFTRMRIEGSVPDSITYVSALKACTSLAVNGVSTFAESKKIGKEIHNLALESGCYSNDRLQGTLIDMYAKCCSIVDAREVFDGMKHPDVVSWNVLILGYADNGQGHNALGLFTKMRKEGPSPDSVTFAAALEACSLVGALDFGRAIHSEINNKINVVLLTCLVDFYAKCGSLVEAESVFNLHEETRDTVTWTALLAGFSSCGDNEAAFRLFERMQDAGFRPDGVTFLCILTCCCHAGLVDKGKEYFDAMSTKYGIIPTIEHYTCMIDIFGRANQFDNAIALLECMPFSPNTVTWMTVLGACRKWKNVEIGRLAFQSLIDLNDENTAAYVLIGQIYQSRGMLQEQEMVMGYKKKLKTCKKLGHSCWTNKAGEVHRFVAADSLEDSQHSQTHEIRCKWESLCVVMRQQGYTRLSQDSKDFEKDEALCGHSERLALVCALINTEPGTTVRIVKNLNVCDDCHSDIAAISRVECRTVFCRDASRIHIFKDGMCSCGDVLFSK